MVFEDPCREKYRREMKTIRYLGRLDKIFGVPASKRILEYDDRNCQNPAERTIMIQPPGFWPSESHFSEPPCMVFAPLLLLLFVARL
jgi:hypothetical protein